MSINISIEEYRDLRFFKQKAEEIIMTVNITLEEYEFLNSFKEQVEEKKKRTFCSFERKRNG